MKISLNILIIFIFLIILIIFLFNIKNNNVDNFVPTINRRDIILNGVNYGNNVQITPCLNKSDDFDTWCKYYQDNNKIPEGMNKNNIGVKKILNGKDGECYLDSDRKKEDINSSRAVCDFNSIEEVPKLDPLLEDSSYNFFTNCHKIAGDGFEDIFKKKCRDLLGTEKIDIEQIMGYDCNPGYGRAKCLKQIDENEYNKENIKIEDTSEEQYNETHIENEEEEEIKKHYKSKYFDGISNSLAKNFINISDKFKTNFGKLL